MTWWEAVVLGVVQGLTEFLPVSSSGHLVLTEALLDIQSPGVVLEVTVHVATLAAVLVVFGPRLATMGRGALRGDRVAWRMIGLVLLASLPAAVVGIGFGEYVARAFESPLVVGVALLVTGGILWMTRGRRGRRQAPSVWGAIVIGLAQAFAVLPGISRSGATIAAAMWNDVEAVPAAEFSFFVAVVAIGGAAVLQLPAFSETSAQIGWVSLAIAFGAALASGILAIRWLLTLLRREAFHRFAPYCWMLGGATLVWVALG